MRSTQQAVQRKASFYLDYFGEGGLSLTVLFLSDLTTDEYIEELTDYRETFDLGRPKH